MESLLGACRGLCLARGPVPIKQERRSAQNAVLQPKRTQRHVLGKWACAEQADTAGARRMRSCSRAAMASGSCCRPRRKEPTVCPAGLGGSRASRGGGGLALRSRSSASTPPRMLPAFSSRSHTCATKETHG